MLRNKNMWNGFFNKIYLFGPTIKNDKLYKTIKIPDGQKSWETDHLIDDLKGILDEQDAKIQSDPKSAPKLLIAFEDITSVYHKVQQKPEFMRCYVQIRHLKATSVAMVHKYKGLERTSRLASQNLMIWPVSNTEIKQIYEDHGPRGVTLDEFCQMMDYAHTKRSEHEKPFFYINKFQPVERRFRRNFTEVLRLNPSALTRPISSKKRKKIKETKDAIEVP